MKQLLIISISFLVLATTIFATEEDYSGNLLIKAKKNGVFFFCSSVTIRPELILTAAHCLDKASEVRVFVKGKIWPVESYHKHPNYNRSKSFYMNDIGIIRLSKSLPKNIIQYKIQRPLSNKKLVRVGFGERNGRNKRQIIKNIGPVQILNDYIKAEDYSSVSGDSGGAIFQKQNSKLVLVGIHSTIDGKYAFNPVLNSKDSWILSQLKK